MPPRRPLRGRVAVAALGLLALFSAIAPPAGVHAATDRLPDLRASRPTDLRITTTSSGRRLLRFTSQMVNYGAGPFEVRGRRPNSRVPFDIDQIIYTSDGGTRRRNTEATVVFAGDGHNHYHVRRMMSYHLWSPAGTVKDRKIGFCFFDTTPKRLSLPRAPRSKRYFESGCGGRSATSTRSGVSVGWGDTYPWNFAYQYIDITGLPGGTYTLRSAVDIYDYFLETSEANNCSYTRISFRTTGTRVTVLGSGSTCVDDYRGTPYAAAVDWMLAQGIGRPCDPGLFCTYNPLTRGEMAAYLSRLRALPEATVDHFDDDDGTQYETHINRAAEAGLLIQCGSRAFCPTRNLRRSEAAVFIARALGLEPSVNDHFSDDNGTFAEPSINAMVDAGLMTGCGDGRFCPSGPVTKGQASAWLFAAFPPAP